MRLTTTKNGRSVRDRPSRQSFLTKDVREGLAIILMGWALPSRRRSTWPSCSGTRHPLGGQSYGRIFYPPDRDQVNVSVITDWARQVNFKVTSREGGIQLCAPLWHEFFHIGDIPTRKEVLSLYDASRKSYIKEELEFNAADDDDPVYEGNVPCTRGCDPSCASSYRGGACTKLADGHRMSDGLDR